MNKHKAMLGMLRVFHTKPQDKEIERTSLDDKAKKYWDSKEYSIPERGYSKTSELKINML